MYFPKTDEFLVSEQIYDRYAFDSYFTASVSGVELSAVQADAEIMLEKSYQYGTEILSLIVRILLTIIIELLVALLFGFREKKAVFVPCLCECSNPDCVEWYIEYH